MKNIHNLMEEQVITCVNDLYEQVKQKGSTWLTCDCENCRLDTISYVLNRIPPRYVVSGRGVIHNTASTLRDSQLAADIQQLTMAGMRMVSMAKRPYHKTKHESYPPVLLETPVYNFPTFMGTIYDGSTFEPLPEAEVLLKKDGEIAIMMDQSWQNPCRTFEQTRGNYSFWVSPEETTEEKLSKEFTFSIEVSAEGYTPSVYTFSVPLVSEKNDRRELNSTYSLKIQDLFLFRSDIVNEQEDIF